MENFELYENFNMKYWFETGDGKGLLRRSNLTFHPPGNTSLPFSSCLFEQNLALDGHASSCLPAGRGSAGNARLLVPPRHDACHPPSSIKRRTVFMVLTKQDGRAVR